MKNIFLLVFILIFSQGFSQEFALPDSGAIVKNNVKSCKVYFTDNYKRHYFDHELKLEYRFNENGQAVYIKNSFFDEGYYCMEYNADRRCCRSVYRSKTGGFIDGAELEYFPDGIISQIKFSGLKNDSIHPYRIVTFNKKGEEVLNFFYLDGILNTAHYTVYDSSGNFMYAKDSSFTDKSKPVRSNSFLTRCNYDSSGHLKDISEYGYDSLGRLFFYCHNTYPMRTGIPQLDDETVLWRFYYDTKNRLSEVQVEPFMEKYNVYSFDYSKNENVPQISFNNREADHLLVEQFKNQFGYLLPSSGNKTLKKFYVPPAPQQNSIHKIRRDQNGNIIEDKITPIVYIPFFRAGTFTYEYEFW